MVGSWNFSKQLISSFDLIFNQILLLEDVIQERPAIASKLDFNAVVDCLLDFFNVKG